MGPGSRGLALPFVLTLVLAGCAEKPAAPTLPAPVEAASAEPAPGLQLSDDRKAATAALLLGSQLSELPAEVTELRIADFRGEPESLRALTALPGLKLLHIGGDISDAHLAEVGELSALKTLNLSRSSVTDKGLAGLKQLKELTLLRMASPAVTDDGMAHIAELKSLRRLHLVDVHVTVRGIDILARMTWLESFYLDGSRASDESLYRLIKAIPGLHFHRDQLHLPKDPNADP